MRSRVGRGSAEEKGIHGQTQRKRVLVLAPSFWPAVNAGGPARSLSNLVYDQSEDYEVTVLTADRDLGADHSYSSLSGRWHSWHGARVFYLDVGSPSQWLRVLRYISKQEFDLILLNSVWNVPFSLVPAMLVRVGILRGPVTLMPRGELEPGALDIKPTKKRLAAPVLKRLHAAVVESFGSTSESEATAIASWLPSARILRTTNSPEKVEFGKPRPRGDEFAVVFVSRINEKKGLLEALRGLSKVTANVQFLVCGPVDGEDYWNQCLRAARHLPSNVRFKYVGPVDRVTVGRVLRDADLFLFLTAGENYGHVIAESLQAGCSVMTTDTTPWSRAIASGGGTLIGDRRDESEIASAIDAWAALTTDELRARRFDAARAFELAVDDQPDDIIRLALTEQSRDSASRNVRGADPPSP